MIRVIQIEGEVLAMFSKVEGGKVTWMETRVVPLPMWRKRNAELGMRNGECGMRNGECGMGNAE